MRWSDWLLNFNLNLRLKWPTQRSGRLLRQRRAASRTRSLRLQVRSKPLCRKRPRITSATKNTLSERKSWNLKRMRTSERPLIWSDHPQRLMRHLSPLSRSKWELKSNSITSSLKDSGTWSTMMIACSKIVSAATQEKRKKQFLKNDRQKSARTCENSNDWKMQKRRE